MASLSNTDYLTYLIDSGPDAQDNLYWATFNLSDELRENISSSNKFKNEDSSKELAVRLIGYTSPSKKVSTISLPFQNTTVDVIVPSSEQNSHKLALTFRLDDGYHLYELMCKSVPLKENGSFDENFREATKWGSIVVTPHRGSSLEENEVVSWAYNNCYLLEVPSLSYGYSKGNALTVNCNFLYQDYTNKIDTSPNVSQNS